MGSTIRTILRFQNQFLPQNNHMSNFISELLLALSFPALYFREDGHHHLRCKCIDIPESRVP